MPHHRPIRGKEGDGSRLNLAAGPGCILGRALINLASSDRANIKIDPDCFASNSTNCLIEWPPPGPTVMDRE